MASFSPAPNATALIEAFRNAREILDARYAAAGREVEVKGEMVFSYEGQKYRAYYKANGKPKIFMIAKYGRYVATGLPVETRVV